VGVSVNEIFIVNRGNPVKNVFEKIEGKEWISRSEVIDLLEVSDKTVYNMEQDDRLKSIRIGRTKWFTTDSIRSLLNVG